MDATPIWFPLFCLNQSEDEGYGCISARTSTRTFTLLPSEPMVCGNTVALFVAESSVLWWPKLLFLLSAVPDSRTLQTVVATTSSCLQDRGGFTVTLRVSGDVPMGSVIGSFLGGRTAGIEEASEETVLRDFMA